MNREAQMEKTALAPVVERVDRFWKPSMIVNPFDSSIHPLNNWTMVAKPRGEIFSRYKALPERVLG